MSMAMETTMGLAFAKARVVPPAPADRLLQVAIDAWAKHPGFGSSAARRQYVIDMLHVEMTYALIEQWDRSVLGQAIGRLLNRAEKAIIEQRPSDTAKAVGGGQKLHDTQRAAAPATQSREAAKPQAERRSEPAIHVEAPIIRAPAAPNLTALADKQAARNAARTKTAIRLSRLDTVMVGGKPIGDCTVGEVKSWAEQRQSDARAAGRDARFALSLVANLPAGAVIREWYKTGDEVDAMYERAEAEHAA